MKRLRSLQSTLGQHAVLCCTLIALVLLIVVIAIWAKSSDDLTAIRDYGLLIAAIVAFPLGFWRSRVAERQADAAQRQVKATQQQLSISQRQAEAAHRQVETAEQSLLNERYQRGAEMLGSDVLAVRLGGIYALQRLANEHPKEYHIQIMRLLCAFVRNPTVAGDGQVIPTDHETGEANETSDSGYMRLRQDVEDAMEAIASRSKEGIGLERDPRSILDLRGATLCGLNLMNFENVDLSWANISSADLSHVNLRPHTDMSWVHAVNTNLSGACLVDVNLSVVRFWGADLSQTILTNANLSRASFLNNGDRPCRLTQAQLDSACADPERPPTVHGVMDAETGEPLVWRDELLRDQA